MDGDLDSVIQQVAASIHQQLPTIITQLRQNGHRTSDSVLRLDFSLVSCDLHSREGESRVPVASIDIDKLLRNYASSQGLSSVPDSGTNGASLHTNGLSGRSQETYASQRASRPVERESSGDQVASKRRKIYGGVRPRSTIASDVDASAALIFRSAEADDAVSPPRRKRMTDNPSLQPSSQDKFFSGVWESIFSSVKLDPTEVIEQWQAIQGTGQPRLLTDTDVEVASRDSSVAAQSIFGRMNILTRKISQASKTCRSLEVLVQAHWVQCFDERVQELSASSLNDKAKKTAIAEACADFNWSEKELRNKMGIWRGYHDIVKHGGYAPLVFAGMGLYRFCKYRVSFNDETFETLRSFRHRFEVAADTLHPRWRQLLSIVGESPERVYTGHPHDWVVCGPNDTPLPLRQTYLQWDKDFDYTHLDDSAIDEEAWDMYDPRMMCSPDAQEADTCQVCGEHQSDDPRANDCKCFPTLYGGPKPSATPVQVYRTPNGRNNGLIACLPFEEGAAVGEFVGKITAGLEGLDVMLGETRAGKYYQIWQGRQGNYTRFVNHSCMPNAEYERFMWRGTQRIVMVSKGIEAGEEITVDYSDTYWKNLDKTCLCGQPNCRYRSRLRIGSAATIPTES